MSPMTMAILALLAWKAVKHFGGSQPGAAPKTGAAPGDCRPKTINAGLPGGGGLGDLLKGGLGGLLAGGAAGSVLSRRSRRPAQVNFSKSGAGRRGEFLGRQGREQADCARRSRQRTRRRSDRAASPRRPACRATSLLKGLSQYLPGVINHLTPDGRLPNEDELSRRL